MKKKVLRLTCLGVYIFFVLCNISVTLNDESKLAGNVAGFVSMIVMIGVPIYAISLQIQDFTKKKVKFKKEAKKITKEIYNFILVYLAEFCFISLYSYVLNVLNLQSISTNEIGVRESLNDLPVFTCIIAIIIGPIIEESIFRFLPYQFINNKKVYVIFSGFVFAILHCIGSPKPIIYLPLYIIKALYWGYRYYKTEDLFVTISMHSLSNLVSIVIYYAT